MPELVDIAVVGVGAAGLMAAISAGRTTRRLNKSLRIVGLDAAGKLGAKMLLAGGGRCNVTHDAVDEEDFAGSTPGAIKKVLRRLDVPATVKFFRGIGVELKREETGKLFPTTDDAHTVLSALLSAAREAGVQLRHPAKVRQVRWCPPPAAEDAGAFSLSGPFGALLARRVILATGGKSLPKTGSDGHGYEIARGLGHHTTSLLLPGLVPLTLHESCFLRRLSGLSAQAAMQVRLSTGKPLKSFTDSTLCTHFGLSGPAALNISRYYLHALAEDPQAALFINWLPGKTPDSLSTRLIEIAGQSGRTTIGRFMAERLPQRLAYALCRHAGVDPSSAVQGLARDPRRRLVLATTDMPLPVTGSRGFGHAEVTAGGVPLKELRLDTMESRLCPGLYLCGEICDVDGRIGGFNFQWAWASGFVAGASAAESFR
jgi:hypothetical protein